MSNKDCNFFVFVHGILGAPENWDLWVKTLQEKHKGIKNADIRILVSKENRTTKSTHVTKKCGERLTKEILDYHKMEILPKKYNKVYLSIISFSFGGLLSRYAIGELTKNKDFWESVIPNHWYSFSSPHLGVKKVGEEKNVRKNLFKFFVNKVACTKLFSGLSGPELILEDKERIFLEISKEGSTFVTGLNSFKTRTLVATTHFDIKVPFSSASIRTYNPYKIPNKNKHKFLVRGIHDFEDSKTLKYIKEYCKSNKFELSKEEKGINDEFKGIELKEKDNQKLYCDNLRIVKYDDLLLKELRKIKFRRIDLEFETNSEFNPYEMHWMYILKFQNLCKKEFKENALKCINFLAEVVINDTSK